MKAHRIAETELMNFIDYNHYASNFSLTYVFWPKLVFKLKLAEIW